MAAKPKGPIMIVIILVTLILIAWLLTAEAEFSIKIFGKTTTMNGIVYSLICILMGVLICVPLFFTSGGHSEQIIKEQTKKIKSLESTLLQREKELKDLRKLLDT